MFDKLKNKSVVVSWIYFFFGLILFITAVFGLFSYSSQKKMRELSLHGAEYAFNAALDSVEYRLSSMMNRYLQLSQNDDLKAIMNKENVDWFHDNNADELLDTVVRMNQADRATVSYIYFKDKNTVLSQNGIFSAERFFDDRFSSKMSYEYWKKLHTGGEIVPHEVVYRTDSYVPSVMMCMPVYESRASVQATDYNVVIGYVSDKKKFFALNENAPWIGAVQLYLLDENGDIIFRSENGAPAEALNINEVRLSGDDAFELSDAFYNNSKKMRFFFRIPLKDLYPEEHLWHIYMWICLAALVTGALCASKIFIGTHYGKIDSMMKMFSDGDKGNEWEFLDNNLKRILEENKSYTQSCRELESKIKRNVLRQTLFINDDAENMREYFRENNVALDAELIRVTLFLIKNDPQREDIKRVCEMLSQVLGTDNIVTLKNGCLAVISGVSELNINAVEENFRAAAESVTQETGFETECFCSEAYFISDIPAAYRDALMKMSKTEDVESNIRNNETNDTAANSEKTLFYTMDDKIEIFDKLFCGNADAVKKTLEDIFRRASEEHSSPRVISIFASDMVSLILDISQQKGIDILKNEAIFDFNKEYIFGNGIAEMKERLFVIVDEISNEITRGEKSAQTRLCEKMFEYIAENYRDPNLSLKTLSNRFSISSSYVSANFSKMYGASPNYFINKYRIDEASKLLANPSLSVEKISQTVGYGHERTFSRNFKKMKGIYPHEYRKLQ